MSMKRVSAAIVVPLVLAAVFSSSAFATATTTRGFWSVAKTTLGSGETRAMKCSAASAFKLTGTVAGAATEIEAKKLECPEGGVISQNANHAEATGTLKFSELAVLKPAGCKTNASITTKALTAKVYMEAATVYLRFEPTEAGGTFATVPLEECAAEGNYPLKGALYGKSTNPTGIEVANQPLEFSEAIQSTAGGALTLGINPAQVSGKANNELLSGATFSALETFPTTPKALWRVAGTKLLWGETRERKCSAFTPFVLNGTVAGAETEIEAKKLECPAGGVIKQNGEFAEATGTFKFSELTVIKPAGCKTNAAITTKALTAAVYMEGSVTYLGIWPTEAGGTFATVPLKECAAEGNYPLKGTVYGRAWEETGVEAVNQRLEFSEAIQNTAGGVLTLGTNLAQLSGGAKNELVSGSTFSVSESGATTTKGFWRVAGTKLASGETRGIKCAAATPFILKSSFAGTTLEMEAKNLECPEGNVIKQNGEQAEVTGTLKFSEIKILKPECKTNASITTKPVTVKVQMEGTYAVLQFAPTEEGGTFATIPFKECAFEGSYTLKGTFYGEASNATGVEAVNQPLKFSEEIQNAAGGSLIFVGPAQLTGKANTELSIGSPFSAKET